MDIREVHSRQQKALDWYTNGYRIAAIRRHFGLSRSWFYTILYSFPKEEQATIVALHRNNKKDTWIPIPN